MKKAAFRVYARETNAFFPWFQRKLDPTERAELLAKFEEEDAANALNEQIDDNF
jgi:hypothetical protein